MASREVRKKEFDDALRSLQITTKIITRHKLDRVRRILTGEIKNDPKLKFWVKKRNFRVIDLPKLGLSKVVVVPSEGGHAMERTIFGVYKKVVPLEELYTVLESVHSNSIRHFGHKTTLFEAQRHYYGITRSAVDKFISICPTCRGMGDHLDGLLGPKKRSMYEKKDLLGNQSNYKRFKVGDVVLLKIPEEFQKGTDIKTLPGIVIAARRRSKVLYQLCCEHGIVSCWFNEDHLEPYGGIVTMDITREITIYKAVKILHMIKTINCNCEDKSNCQCAKNVADSVCGPPKSEPGILTNFRNGTTVTMVKFSDTELEERYNRGLCAAQFCQEPKDDITVECSYCNGRFHTMCLSSQPAVYENFCYCGCNSQDMANIKVNLEKLQEAEEHLKRVVNCETASWRLKWWKDQETAKELKKFSHFLCLEAGSHDQIMNYFLTKEFVKLAVESSVLRVAFILDVLLPEAVIHYIQQKQTVTRCFAEKFYSKYLPCQNQVSQ